MLVSFDAAVIAYHEIHTYYQLSKTLLFRLRRPVGRMTIVEQQLEGEYRYVNSRLITHRFTAVIAMYFFMLV